MRGLRPPVQIEPVGVRAVHERRQRATDEAGTIDPQQLRRRQVHLDNRAIVRERQVAERCSIVKGPVEVTALLEIDVRPAELVVLHLELDLVDLQLVQQAHGIEPALGTAGPTADKRVSASLRIALPSRGPGRGVPSSIPPSGERQHERRDVHLPARSAAWPRHHINSDPLLAKCRAARGRSATVCLSTEAPRWSSRALHADLVLEPPLRVEGNVLSCREPSSFCGDSSTMQP